MFTAAIVLALCSTPLCVTLPLCAGSAEVHSQRTYHILNKEEVHPCKAGIFRHWRMKIKSSQSSRAFSAISRLLRRTKSANREHESDTSGVRPKKRSSAGIADAS